MKSSLPSVNHVTEELYPGDPEFTLGELGVQFFLLKQFQDLPKVFFMFLLTFGVDQNVIDEDNYKLVQIRFTHPVHKSWECLLLEPSTGDTLTSDRSLNKYSILAAGRIGHRSLGVGSGSSLSVCSIPCNRCTSGKTRLSSLQTEPELPRVVAPVPNRFENPLVVVGVFPASPSEMTIKNSEQLAHPLVFLL
ncbi:hypothetical protein Tco_1055939 [Tanacetum coccineum]|uniref:Uncharacterized protein n=1 Tax=Tanacetum coccineum TaxID=301880 RepID=A0ABQ5H2V6_9ASTR